MDMKPTDEKAKVTILAGFLGAGKTTLLKRLLAWQGDLTGTVVIVNEFGEVGIDGAMLKGDASDMVELSSGCVCCTLKADFNRELKRIWQQLAPKRILIEATGVADPDAIRQAFDDTGIREHMAVHQVITVVDADFWEAREHFGPLFYHQLEDGDLILLNKIDLVGEAKVPQMLAEIHETIPGTQVIPTRFCAVDPETILAPDPDKDYGRDPGEFFQTGDHDHDHDPEEHERFVPFYYINEAPFSEACFQQFTADLPWEVFRMKGSVKFTDRTRLLNYVGGKSEWLDWSGPSETRLAFVGMGVAPDEILARLDACIAGG